MPGVTTGYPLHHITTNSTVLRRQKDGPVTCVITSTWEVSIEETSYVATIAVALRVGSFTSMYNYYFLFDVAITNSYILHKNFTSNTIRNVKQFRLQLAKELIGTYCSRKTSGRSCGLPRTLLFRVCPQEYARNHLQNDANVEGVGSFTRGMTAVSRVWGVALSRWQQRN